MNEIKLRLVRPPGKVNTWTNELIHQDKDVIISKFRYSNMKRPAEIEGRIIADNDYAGICYEFVKRGYEIIKIFDLEDRLTGYYCNINTPPKPFEGGYEVKDLFLDVWVFPDLEYSVLDEDEFEDAFDRGLISEEEKIFARAALKRILKELKSSNFPPGIVDEIG